MKAWINLTLLGILGGLILFIGVAILFGLGFGFGFSGSSGSLETITYIDAPPIEIEQALNEIENGRVSEITVVDNVGAIDEDQGTVEDWYEYESGGDVTRWRAEGLQVFVQPVQGEERVVFGPNGETIGFEPEPLRQLMEAVENWNATSTSDIVITDLRPAR
jgi:hypothetical protein